MSKNGASVLIFMCVSCLFVFAENTGCITELEPINLFGKKTQQIVLKGECSVFAYEDEAIADKSISRIVLMNTPTNETSNTAFATVTIYEYKEDERKYMLVKSDPWTVNSNKTFKRSHFSRSLKLKIMFVISGIWLNSNITLCYEEIEFKKFELHSSDVNKNEISPWGIFDDDWHYRPNSNYIFHIDENETLSSSNILITLNELDIDLVMGEYFLIGAGLQPFEGPPPLSINEAVEKKKYLVDEKAAYIVLATNATSRPYRGFSISWDFTGTAIEVPEIIEKEDVKKSAPICIYNIAAAKEEFGKSGDYFKDFRENFAEVATNYTTTLKTLTGESPTSDDIINASSINIFRISGKFKDDKSHEALYAMVKITKDSTKGKAAFEDQKQLEEIISLYSEKVAAKEINDIFEFRKCGTRYVPESWFYFGLILIIPVVCFAAILWIWKQNPIAEYYEKKRMLKRASQQLEESQHQKYYYDADHCDFPIQSANSYITLPKVLLTNEEGRRTTLNLSDTLLCDENASDDELFNKMFVIKRRSDVLELQRMERSFGMFSTKSGEDNAAFDMNEDHDSTTRQQEVRAEHTYESLRSTASMSENTRL